MNQIDVVISTAEFPMGLQPSTESVYLCENEEQGVAIAGVAKILETMLRRIFHGRNAIRIAKQFGSIGYVRVRVEQ